MSGLFWQNWSIALYLVMGVSILVFCPLYLMLALNTPPLSLPEFALIHSEFTFWPIASVFTCHFHCFENKIIALIPIGVNYLHCVHHRIFHFQPKMAFCTRLAHVMVRGGNVGRSQKGGKYFE